jgi:SAP domain-containing new25
MNKLLNIKTIQDFENGYWYLSDLKEFAKHIGVNPVSKLRKDELEKIIRTYLKTGKILSLKKAPKTKAFEKDYQKGLSLEMEIVNYTSNKITKDFIKLEAKKINNELIEKSGVWYRLNRWRDNKLENGEKITYKDLVKEYIRLNQISEDFEKIPHVRYINFLSDYLQNEKGSTRKEAISNWHKLKEMKIPKTYKDWKKNNKTV